MLRITQPRAQRRIRSIRYSHSQIYSPKVRAFPFKVSQEDAIREMAPYASLFAFRTPIRDLISRIFPALGLIPTQPTRIRPVYFPGWFVDTEIEVTVWTTNNGHSEQHSATIDFSGSYMPGFAFEPLSRLSFNDPNLDKFRAVPFSEDLKNQHGVEISCLPYTISPFSLLETARSFPSRQATIHEHIHFDPTSVKTNLLAAYPVLFPIYLAEYECKGTLPIAQGAKVPFIMDAHSPKGRIAVHPVLPENLRGILPPCELLEYRDWLERPFAQVDKSIHQWATELSEWLDGMITRPGAASKLGDNTLVDMSDPRIRELTDDEVLGNRAYILAQDVMKRKEIKPGWWKDWESSQ